MILLLRLHRVVETCSDIALEATPAPALWELAVVALAAVVVAGAVGIVVVGIGVDIGEKTVLAFPAFDNNFF